MKSDKITLTLIHKNDRNNAYKAVSKEKIYYIKKSQKSGEKLSSEFCPLNLFRKVTPDKIPKAYEAHQDNILVTEWLEGYKWLEYDLSSDFSCVYQTLAQTLSYLYRTNTFEFIKLTLSDKETDILLNSKKKLIAMYVSVYKSLCENGRLLAQQKLNCTSNYKMLLDRFVAENKILIHGDLNSSNILVNSLNEIKIVDFEFSTFSSIEFELGRFFASFSMQGMENFRQHNEFTDKQQRLINNLNIIYTTLKAHLIIDSALLIQYIGFYVINIIFYHYNNFTRIKNKSEYINYFLPYATFLMKNPNDQATTSDNTFIKELLGVLKSR